MCCPTVQQDHVVLGLVQSRDLHDLELGLDPQRLQKLGCLAQHLRGLVILVGRSTFTPSAFSFTCCRVGHFRRYIGSIIESAPAITFAAAAAPALPPMVEEPVVDVVEDALWLTWLFWWMSEACSRSCDGLLPHIPNTGPLCPPQSRSNVAICRPSRPYSPCRTGSNDMVCQP